ncbi:MAG: glycosyltransferase family 39 protein [Candidatus Xenobiia bacterium LiM19]
MELSRQTLEGVITRGFFPFLSLLFLSVIIAAGVLIPPAAASLRKISRMGWLSLSALILLCISIWIFFAPHIPHVYFDQFLHLDMAHNMARYQLCAYTDAGSPSSWEQLSLRVAWPPAYSYMLSLVFMICGSIEGAAFALTLIFSIMSLMIMYFLIYSLTGRETRAFWGGFLLAISPVFIKYSATYSLEVCSLAFLLLSAWSVVITSTSQSSRTYLASLMIIIWTCHIRAENILIILSMTVLVTISYWIFYRKKPPLSFQSIMTGAGLFILLMIPLLLELYYIFVYTRPPEWKRDLSPYGGALAENILPNILFLLGKGEFHPLIITILSITGIAIVLRKDERRDNPMMTVLPLSWLIICLILYSSYLTGKFGYYPDSDRFSLNLLVSLSYLGACTIELALSYLPGWLRPVCITACIIALTLTSWIPLRNSITRTTARPVYQEYQFIRSLENESLPDWNVPFVCSTPSKIILLLSRRAMTMDYFIHHMDTIDEAILFQDFFWCEAQNSERMAEVEMEIQDHYTIQYLKHTDDGTNRYGIYLLKKK